jgi:hypothetical protein
MKTKATITHGALLLALIAAAGMVQAASDKDVVWVENDSFAFAACSAATAGPSSEQIAATTRKLSEQANADLEAIVRASGVQLTQRQYMTITPIDGALDCGGSASRVTYHVTAVDQVSGQLWASDMTVSDASPSLDRVALNQLAGDLARRFSVAVAKATTR